MPCDTVREVSIDFKVANLDVMMQALRSLNLNPQLQGDTIVFNGGRYKRGDSEITMTSAYGARDLANQISRSYSAQIVQNNMRRMGFKMSVNKTTGKMVFTKA